MDIRELTRVQALRPTWPGKTTKGSDGARRSEMSDESYRHSGLERMKAAHRAAVKKASELDGGAIVKVLRRRGERKAEDMTYAGFAIKLGEENLRAASDRERAKVEEERAIAALAAAYCPKRPPADTEKRKAAEARAGEAVDRLRGVRFAPSRYPVSKLADL